MRLPVDTSVVHFVSAGPAEPSVDFDTKQQKIDANGVAVNQVHLFVVGDGGTREVITVKVSGEVRGLGQFTPVKVTDLVASTWSMNDRSGVSFSASKIEAIAPRPGVFLMARLGGASVLVALMLVGLCWRTSASSWPRPGLVLLGRYLRRHGV